MESISGFIFTMALVFQPTTALKCTSPQGATCLQKTDMPAGFQAFMLGGDPCFLYKNKRWCFVSKSGTLNPCSCTPECGCRSTGPEPPKCDNSQVPSSPNCTDDKATFCSLDYKGYKNTMCLYCGVNTVSCNKLCTRGLSEADIQVIVAKHNDLRRKVAKGLESRGDTGPQPKAADMFELAWDETLASSAQRWADQCPKDHDKNRIVPEFSYVGQNMAESWSSVATPEKGLDLKIQSWYEEVVSWPASKVTNFQLTSAVTGHYTQLIWGETTKVGCGFVSYLDATQDHVPFHQTLICNYGIGGNFLGAKVYTPTSGSPGSGCPRGVNDGLCAQ